MAGVAVSDYEPCRTTGPEPSGMPLRLCHQRGPTAVPAPDRSPQGAERERARPGWHLPQIRAGSRRETNPRGTNIETAPAVRPQPGPAARPMNLRV